jgi:hypothetical protein
MIHKDAEGSASPFLAHAKEYSSCLLSLMAIEISLLTDAFGAKK